MYQFRIPDPSPAYITKSIRFPKDMIEQVKGVIEGTNCTFSAFVLEAARAALESLKDV